MLRDFFQIILIVALSLMFRLISGCPSPCICKWKSGKQTVECGGHKLPNIPDGLDHTTQVLNFSHNSLTVLQSERFQKMELINLQKIFLSNNELIRINDRAFRGLSNLVELDLSDNMLTSIPTETFQDYSSLMRLSLSGNPIRDLKTSAFKYLSYLTTLELSNCQISVIEDEAFIGLEQLEWLKLDGNRIANIRGSHILPESLNGISLHGNRWVCDCKLMDIYGWLTTNAVPMIEEPKCFQPQKLQGQQIKSLQSDELACVPTISPTTIYLEIAEGRNISLLCKITAFPEASISWWFQGQILQNDTIIAPNLHLYYYIEEGLDEKRSELFIFNADINDNGTFACIAENTAGRVQANYTIRVIVKEEPIVEEVTNNEIFLFIIGGAIVICLLSVVCCCIIICKCRNQAQNCSSNRRKKKKKGKEVSLPNPQKCVAIANDINSSLVCSKINGNLTITDNNQQEMLLYLGNNQNISINDMSLQGHCGPQDRNPDLINDASLRQRNEGDMKQHQRDDEKEKTNDNNFSLVPILRPIPARFHPMSTLPRGGGNNNVSRDMYQVDVHLNPSCFIDTNGYPVEYSLTQIPLINQTPVPVNYNYKTLPHNRLKAGSSVVRFANEAEFIRTSQTFHAYSPDVRYTAEGLYPCSDSTMIETSNFPSPPEGYKTDNISSLPALLNNQNQNFCPNSLAIQQQQQKWPSCLPAYHPQLIAVDTRFQMSPQQPLQSPTSQQNPLSVTKICVGVGAQTIHEENNVIHEEDEEDENDDCNDGSSSQSKCRQLKGPLADSPDEGYEDESIEGTDI